MSNLLPEFNDELWRRTRPELFDVPVSVASSPLRTVGPGRALSGVTVVPFDGAVNALATARFRETPLRPHGLSAAIPRLGCGGVVVHVGADVPPGTVVALDSALVTSECAVVRNLVVLEAGAEVTLVERLIDEVGDGQLLVGTQVQLGDGARLNYRRHLRVGRRVYGELESEVGRDGALTLTTFVDGQGVAKLEEVVRLQGEGSDVDSAFYDSAERGLRVDLFQETHHEAPHTRSRVEAHGAVAARGYSLHHGLTRIAASAPESDTYFTSRHLILDTKARADAIPKMEINTDAVKAGHGATSGDLDQSALFYLMSRGISHSEARELLVRGFFASLHERFPELDGWEVSNVAP